MGDPVSVRTFGSRTIGAALPVDAYSLAVTCGGRGVSLRHLARQPFGTRRAARCPVPRARQGSLPATRDTSRHDLITAETPECPPAARFRASRLPDRRWYRPRPRVTATWRTVPLRCVDRPTLHTVAAVGTWDTLQRPSHNAGPSGPATPPSRRQRECGALYHPVITPAPPACLADHAPPLAWRPIWRPVTTERTHFASERGTGECNVVRQPQLVTGLGSSCRHRPHRRNRVRRMTGVLTNSRLSLGASDPRISQPTVLKRRRTEYRIHLWLETSRYGRVVSAHLAPRMFLLRPEWLPATDFHTASCRRRRSMLVAEMRLRLRPEAD